MRNTDKLIESGDELPAYSFRSSFVIVAGFGGVCAVSIDGYLIWRFWAKAPDYVVFVLGLLIGIQLIYQWFRVMRYCARIQELESESQGKGTPRSPALQFAIRGMLDVLFFSYGIASAALILIGTLLARLTHG